MEIDGHDNLGRGCRVPFTVLRDCVDGCFQAHKGHATPTWSEPKNLWASLRTAEQRHLLVNRRKTSPTAMGRTSPFSFARATRLAPAKCIDSERGPLPLAKMLTTDSNACRAAPCSAPQTASSKCWARRPEGPGAEDLENACRKMRISSAGIRQPPRVSQWRGTSLRSCQNHPARDVEGATVHTTNAVRQQKCSRCECALLHGHDHWC